MDNVNLILAPFSESQLEAKFKKWLGEILDERLPASIEDPNNNQVFITPKEFCKRTDTALQSYYNNAHKIPGSTKFGRKWLIDWSIFEQHLKNKAVPA